MTAKEQGKGLLQERLTKVLSASEIDAQEFTSCAHLMCRYAVILERVLQRANRDKIIFVLHGLVSTLEDASHLFCDYRDRHNLGSELMGARVLDTTNGIDIARISPNGSVWPCGESSQPLYKSL